MDEGELRQSIKNSPIFSYANLHQWFPDEEETSMKVQISRFLKKGIIAQVRQGLYVSGEYTSPNSFVFAEKIYSPSYISFETALSYYGVIPDIPFSITSATTNPTREFKTHIGNFIFRTIKSKLFFGFSNIVSDDTYQYGYKIASVEKALLDFFYIHKNIDSLDELRLRTDIDFSVDTAKKYALEYPKRVRDLLHKYLLILANE